MGALNRWQIGCCCGGGDICVDLASPCHDTDNDSVTVTVSDGTGTVATGTTDTSGHVCFTGLSGTYTVKAEKASCSTLTWTGVTPGTNLTADFVCTTGRTIFIKGCWSLPLEGANISITGPESASLTSGADGYAYFYPTQTGTYTVVVTAPGFNTSTTTWTQAALCATTNSNITLFPDSSHFCNPYTLSDGVTKTPWPLPKIISCTDAGGTSSYNINAGSDCFDRVMDSVSSSASAVFTPCTPSGNVYKPPSDIGSASTGVKYVITTVGTSIVCYQQTKVGNSGNAVHYRAADSDCTPADTYQAWRLAASCPISSTNLYTWISGEMDVTSLHPFFATFTWTLAPGSGYGPSPTNVTPAPFSTTITLFE